MQTVTIDILNEKALVLLKNLEGLKLIRMRKEPDTQSNINWQSKYKGAMQKQPLDEIDAQFNELRDSWE